MKLPGDIHELILEDLASKLDVLGQEKLEAWLEENGENKEICRKFCSLWYSGKWANSPSRNKETDRLGTNSRAAKK